MSVVDAQFTEPSEWRRVTEFWRQHKALAANLVLLVVSCIWLGWCLKEVSAGKRAAEDYRIRRLARDEYMLARAAELSGAPVA